MVNHKFTENQLEKLFKKLSKPFSQTKRDRNYLVLCDDLGNLFEYLKSSKVVHPQIDNKHKIKIKKSQFSERLLIFSFADKPSWDTLVKSLAAFDMAPISPNQHVEEFLASHPLSHFSHATEGTGFLNATNELENSGPIVDVVNTQNSLSDVQLIASQMEVEIKRPVNQDSRPEDKDLRSIYLQDEQIRCYKEQAFEAEAKYKDIIQKLKDLAQSIQDPEVLGLKSFSKKELDCIIESPEKPPISQALQEQNSRYIFIILSCLLTRHEERLKDKFLKALSVVQGEQVCYVAKKTTVMEEEKSILGESTAQKTGLPKISKDLKAIIESRMKKGFQSLLNSCYSRTIDDARWTVEKVLQAFNAAYPGHIFLYEEQ
jgi:hypothetical protein